VLELYCERFRYEMSLKNFFFYKTYNIVFHARSSHRTYVMAIVTVLYYSIFEFRVTVMKMYTVQSNFNRIQFGGMSTYCQF